MSQHQQLTRAGQSDLCFQEVSLCCSPVWTRALTELEDSVICERIDLLWLKHTQSVRSWMSWSLGVLYWDRTRAWIVIPNFGIVFTVRSQSTLQRKLVQLSYTRKMVQGHPVRQWKSQWSSLVSDWCSAHCSEEKFKNWAYNCPVCSISICCWWLQKSSSSPKRELFPIFSLHLC